MNAIRHIEFWVSNLPKSLDFYGELLAILGWEKVDENGFSATDGTKIYFIEQKIFLLDQKAPGPRHVCFQTKKREIVDDVAKLPGVLERILHGPSELHRNGSYMLVFKDPDGYVLEVAYKTAN